MADPEVEHLGIMAYAAYYTKLKPVKVNRNAATFDGNFDTVYVGKEVGLEFHPCFVHPALFSNLTGLPSISFQYFFKQKLNWKVKQNRARSYSRESLTTVTTLAMLRNHVHTMPLVCITIRECNLEP